MNESIFEFDCPSRFVDLSQEDIEFRPDNAPPSPYWSTYHASHDQVLDSSNQNLGKRRFACVNSKADGNENVDPLESTNVASNGSNKLASCNSPMKESTPALQGDTVPVAKIKVAVVAASKPSTIPSSSTSTSNSTSASASTSASGSSSSTSTAQTREQKLLEFRSKKNETVATSSKASVPSKGSKRPSSSSSSSSSSSCSGKTTSGPIISSKTSDDVENKRRKIDSVSTTKSTSSSVHTTANKKPIVSVKENKNININNKKTVINAIDDDLTELLKAHNRKVGPKAAYEPPRHSVRDVRKWEQKTGKLWATLSADERVQANEDIAAMKRE